MDFMDMLFDSWNEEARNEAEKKLNKAIENRDKEAEEKARQKIKECNQYELNSAIYESMKD